jgi:selenocysteine-specific elongation factor
VRTLVIGTAGHVDHGKTTLVRALTGIETDRFREEKERGLTIDIGFAHLELGDDLQAGIVDVPGHQDFISNMLAGSTGIDAVLLVIAADEGPMPQTREHLQVARLLGLAEGVVALSHADRVESGFAELAEDAVREELGAILGRDDWPIVRVDSVRGAGIDELRIELARLAERVPVPPPDPLFRLPVDRSFTVAGTGTVVTGTVWTGEVAIGDRLYVLPGGREVRVRSLQAHGAELPRVGSRRRCAIGLVGVGAADIGRGDTLVSAPEWRATSRVGLVFDLLPDAGRILEHGTRLRVWLGTREVMARLALPDRTAAVPGERGCAVLDLESPLAARVGDRCLLRFYSPVELLGGATVAELDPPRRWRARATAWDTIVAADPAASASAAIRLAGGRGITPEALRLAVPGPAVDDPAEAGAAVRIGDRWFAPELRDDVTARIVAWLTAAHAAAPRQSTVPLESLRAAIDGVAPELVAAAISALVDAGSLWLAGPMVRLGDHEAVLSDGERRSAAALAEAIAAGGLMPPTPEELTQRLATDRGLVNDLLRLGVEDGAYVQVNPDIYLAVAAEAALRASVLEVLAATPVVPPTEFREALGVTRRFLIPLLEYLDGIGWTRRTGEGRIEGPAAGAATDRPSAGQSR